MSTERRTKRRAGESGFTMIELLVVVMVIGIMSAVSYPAISRYRRNSQIRGATDQVAGELQTARLRAITRNATRGIFFATINDRQYQWVEVPKTAFGTVDFATLAGGDVRTLPQGVVFVTPATTSTIGFNSLGALCTGINVGCATLTNTPGTNYITVAGGQATVVVRQPSTQLRRTITVTSGGRVNR